MGADNYFLSSNDITAEKVLLHRISQIIPIIWFSNITDRNFAFHLVQFTSFGILFAITVTTSEKL